MIEATIIYDLLPNIDEGAYWEFIKKAAAIAMQAPNIEEFRAHRDVLSAPRVRITTVWPDLTDWAAFTQGSEWQALDTEVRKFVCNFETSIWTPSPFLNEPYHPQ